MTPDPVVDSRRAADVAAQARAMFTRFVPGWSGTARDAASNALIGIFARYCEIVIDRLNQAPGKNLLAFLNLLGAEPLPVQPARVPLTFYLTANAQSEVVVPARSQVTAPPPPGIQGPIVFETEQEFIAIPARLDALLVRDPAHDKYADRSLLLQDPAAVTPGEPVFSGDAPIQHSFYVPLGAIAAEPMNKLTLRVEIARPAAHPLALAWSVVDRGAERAVAPASDATGGFTKTGDVVFQTMPPLAAAIINGQRDRWLKCRLAEPALSAMPRIARITVTPEVARTAIPVEKAFSNLAPIDLSKDFFPFGAAPRFGDTFYISSAGAFAAPGATVTLHVKMTNPASAGNSSPVQPVAPRATQLSWEFWDGSQWAALGVSDFGRTAPWPSASFSDSTQAFSQSGDVTFQFGAPPRPSVVSGQSGCWVRVRVVFGDYGREASYQPNPPAGVIVTPATLSPPVIHSIDCEYRVANTSEPAAVIAYNDFAYAPLSRPCEPFQASAEKETHAYFGFASPAPSFPGRGMNLYLAMDRSPASAAARTASPPSLLTWEYWNGSAWAARSVRDNTSGFRRSGVVQFVTPADLKQKNEFGLTRYWWRVRRATAGDASPPPEKDAGPRLRFAVLNTVMAANTQTTFFEVMGSGNGLAGQRFQTARKPVLAGQRLEVIEPRMPTDEELDRIRKEEGPSAVNKPELAATALNPEAVWIRWHEVAGFDESDSFDRHYVVNHETGIISFGDGVNGKAPPLGTNNIRFYRYQTGGGSIGNLPPLAISQLKTTIPYIERATNLEPSGGGADTEPLTSLLERAPRVTRHSFRAVASSDFEDLAILASPAVARALCVAGHDLISDPDAVHEKGGAVSLVIVPRSSDPAPAPDSELLDRVREYLDDRRAGDLELILLGPEYVRIDVTAEMTIEDPGAAADIETAVKARISALLHPLTGGLDSKGWAFGQMPAESDLYSTIEAIPGVSYVRLLRISTVDDIPGARARGRFLIRAGEFHISSRLSAQAPTRGAVVRGQRNFDD